MYEERFYRSLSRSQYTLEISHKESDLFISTDKAIDKDIAYDVLRKYYGQIEDYIKKTPLFFTSLSPLEIDNDASPIVQEMLECSQETRIGPFASVAGAIALYVGRELLQYTDEVIVENGGDIFLKINEDKKIGVYLGERFAAASSILNENPIALKVKKRDNSFGMASSSAYIGHSLNFGMADLVTVIATDAIIAEGFATALSNRIKKEADVNEVLNIAKNIPLIEGLLIAYEGKIFLWGELQIDGE